MCLSLVTAYANCWLFNSQQLHSLCVALQTETLINERALALEQRDRLMRIREDRDKFVAELQRNRTDVYKVLLVRRCLCSISFFTIIAEFVCTFLLLFFQSKASIETLKP